MKSIISIFLLFALGSTVSNAATFFPTPEELSLSGTQSLLSSSELSSLLQEIPEDQDFYQIDDMLFPISPLIQTQAFTGNKWPNGIVYYAFDPAVTLQNQQRFVDAADEWEAVADLTFLPRTNQTNYIYVQNGVGNSSYVGMIGGRQELTMFNWSWKYIIVHEIGHALGLSHEQSRSDRDQYVTILFNNIQQGREHNFNIRNNSINHTQYDFESVMHYGKTAFSIDSATLNTIEPKPAYSSFLNIMGQRTFLSQLDKSGMGIHYGVSALTPDLYISNFSVAPTSVSTIDTIDINTEISNQGSGASTSSTLKIYRSTNSFISTNDTQVATQPVPALSTSASNSILTSVTVPTQPGSYYYGACVDTVSNESDINNNCSNAILVTVNTGIQPDGFEPDNTLAQASPIQNGQTLPHSIHLNSDEDWHTFTLPADGTNITIETDGPSGDTELYLLDSSGTQIDYDDDDGNNRFSIISLPSLTAGTYFIRVTSYNRATTLDSYTTSLFYTTQTTGGGNTGSITQNVELCSVIPVGNGKYVTGCL